MPILEGDGVAVYVRGALEAEDHSVRCAALIIDIHRSDERIAIAGTRATVEIGSDVHFGGWHRIVGLIGDIHRAHLHKVVGLDETGVVFAARPTEHIHAIGVHQVAIGIGAEFAGAGEHDLAAGDILAVVEALEFVGYHEKSIARDRQVGGEIRGGDGSLLVDLAHAGGADAASGVDGSSVLLGDKSRELRVNALIPDCVDVSDVIRDMADRLRIGSNTCDAGS